MDIFEASDYDFLLSRKAKKAFALILLVGVACVPSIRRWYLDQVEHHAQHISREVMSRLSPATSDSTPPEPRQVRSSDS